MVRSPLSKRAKLLDKVARGYAASQVHNLDYAFSQLSRDSGCLAITDCQWYLCGGRVLSAPCAGRVDSVFEAGLHHSGGMLFLYFVTMLADR